MSPGGEMKPLVQRIRCNVGRGLEVSTIHTQFEQKFRRSVAPLFVLPSWNSFTKSFPFRTSISALVKR